MGSAIDQLMKIVIIFECGYVFTSFLWLTVMILKAQANNDDYCIRMINGENTMVTIYFSNTVVDKREATFPETHKSAVLKQL